MVPTAKRPFGVERVNTKVYGRSTHFKVKKPVYRYRSVYSRLFYCAELLSVSVRDKSVTDKSVSVSVSSMNATYSKMLVCYHI